MTTYQCGICGWRGHNVRGHAKWSAGVELRHAETQLQINRDSITYWSERLGRTVTRCKVLRRDFNFLSPRDQHAVRRINFL